MNVWELRLRQALRVRDDTTNARRHSLMKFRFVLLGPDDDPEGDPSAREDPPGVPHTASRARCYEQREAGIVRRENCSNGRWRIIPVANFHARIVRDILLDDGEEERREFGVEAELGGRKLIFAVSAAEFGRMGLGTAEVGTGGDRVARPATAC
jgi:hypothetical protein